MAKENSIKMKENQPYGKTYLPMTLQTKSFNKRKGFDKYDI